MHRLPWDDDDDMHLPRTFPGTGQMHIHMRWMSVDQPACRKFGCW